MSKNKGNLLDFEKLVLKLAINKSTILRKINLRKIILKTTTNNNY
jgi:hypothetical protein